MYRRFFLFIAVICLVGSLMFFGDRPPTQLSVGRVTVFASSQVCLPEGTVWTALGDGMVIDTCLENLEEILDLVQVLGITFETKNTAAEIVSHFGARVEKRQTIASVNVYTYFLSSPLFSNYIEIDGRKIGAQIAVTPSAVLVGFPMILGSF